MPEGFTYTGKQVSTLTDKARTQKTLEKMPRFGAAPIATSKEKEQLDRSRQQILATIGASLALLNSGVGYERDPNMEAAVSMIERLVLGESQAELAAAQRGEFFFCLK